MDSTSEIMVSEVRGVVWAVLAAPSVKSRIEQGDTHVRGVFMAKEGTVGLFAFYTPGDPACSGRQRFCSTRRGLQTEPLADGMDAQKV